ncbi:MAG: 4-hydroxythreonine-4-phosphate dehydrogenase PdxA, partial [Sulfurovum sp.]|nr:4-hydroxythreonine-4-phosphate dehydrogenase PdxA [Sulfurovum sp.]
MSKKKVAISVGDLNGIGIQLAIENHDIISKEVEARYCIDRMMLEQSAKKLKLQIPTDFQTMENIAAPFEIQAGAVTKESGTYAYASFVKAVELARNKEVDAITTLPIHKKAWELAGVNYKGHTDALRDIFDAEAIMMLGSPKMYVALFTEHIPLKEVAGSINEKDLTRFLIDFYHTAKPTKQV